MLRPTDLFYLARFFRRAQDSEITAHIWPKVQPESGHLPLRPVFSQSIGRSPSHGRAWVVEKDGQIAGMVTGSARCGGLVWDVEHLHVAEDGPGEAAELLDRLCLTAVETGARRVFLEAPAGARGLEIAKRAGFERYTESSVYRLDPPFTLPRAEHFEGRPRLRADEQALFQLYNAAVPPIVRSAEAMSYEEWSALHRGRRRWSPSLVGDRHQYVWELGEGLSGWLEVVYGQKSQYLELLVNPKYETMLDRFITYALKQVSEKAAVYSAVREYQTGLAATLERVGFKLAGRFDMYVRQLAVRVPERKLVPAKIAGG